MNITFSDIENILQEPESLPKFQKEKEAFFWNSLTDIGTNISICSADKDEINCVWSKQLFTIRVTIEEIIIELSTGAFDSILKHILNYFEFQSPSVILPLVENFIIQYHAKKLAEFFNCYVSIPLPSEIIFDEDRISNFVRDANMYAQNKLIVEIPFSKQGVIASQKMKREGYATTITETYSCRQLLLIFNYEIADIATLNISKINNYFETNQLGKGRYIGQKIAKTTQNKKNSTYTQTKQKSHLLVCGLQSYLQICELGGVDVIELSPLEAISAKEKLAPGFDSSLNQSHYSTKRPSYRAYKSQSNKFWELSLDEENLLYFQSRATNSIENILVEHEDVLSGFFPLTSENYCHTLALQGPIPKHETWRKLLTSNKVSPDSLLTTAGIIEKQKLNKQLRKLIYSKIKQVNPSVKCDF